MKKKIKKKKKKKGELEMDESKKMAKLAVEALEDKKASGITILDISSISTIADYFVIADGSNQNQVHAMIDNVEDLLGKAGYSPKQVEGYATGNWVLMDYRNIIIHVFDKENRLFYDLERIWRDGKRITAEEL